MNPSIVRYGHVRFGLYISFQTTNLTLSQLSCDLLSGHLQSSVVSGGSHTALVLFRTTYSTVGNASPEATLSPVRLHTKR